MVIERGTPVIVDALRSVGVAPVTLRFTALSPTTLYPPAVLNRTAGLDVVSIEVLQEPNPRYEVTVRNVSSQPALNFHVVARRGDRRALFGNQGHRDASPVIAANGAYSFVLDPAREMRSNSGEWAPTSHDTIEITSVLWEDGTIEGDPEPMAAVLASTWGEPRSWLARLQCSRQCAALRIPRRRDSRCKGQIERLSIEPDTAVSPQPANGCDISRISTNDRSSARFAPGWSPREVACSMICERRRAMTSGFSGG